MTALFFSPIFVRILVVKAILGWGSGKYGLAGTPLVDVVYKDLVEQYLYL